MKTNHSEQVADGVVEELTFTSCDDLFEVLRPSHEFWVGPYRLWGFRGQACASWPLVPSAFRESFNWYLPDARRDKRPVFEAQIENEIAAFEDFVYTADEIGQTVPGSSFLMGEEYNSRRRVHSEWPFPELMEGLALAQHHGTPTRFLDMTYNPLVAAFYAAYQRWIHGGSKNVFHSDYFCVWAVNLHFVHHSYHNAESRRIDTLNVPAASNPYLHAQRAHFMWDRHANKCWPPPSIDEVIAVRAQDPRAWECVGRRPSYLSCNIRLPIIRKLMLKYEHTRDLLLTLSERERISLAHLMPSLDRVTETYCFLRDLAQTAADDAVNSTAPLSQSR